MQITKAAWDFQGEWYRMPQGTERDLGIHRFRLFCLKQIGPNSLAKGTFEAKIGVTDGERAVFGNFVLGAGRR
jgi:hypothetical protein